MNADTREQVRSNAKYLQNVRPIDPEEIAEYVEGQPHPAVVRQILREEAFDLGLIEREDGTFAPVSEEPIEPRKRTVERFPERYGRRLEDLLVERFGPGWPDGETGERLRETIRQLKDEYYRQHPVEYDAEVALGYAVYHLPDYYAAVQYVLDELAEDGLLPRKLRVLDVGAGVGGPALGLFDYLPDDALVEYHAVEPSAAADVLDAMLEAVEGNVHPTVHRTTAESFDPDGEYDLLLFANVLSELDEPTAVARRYLDFLASDGSFVAIAPADRNTSIGLRSVERALEDGYTVYSPTVRLWPDERPTDRGWSFDVKPELDVPSFQERLDDGSGEFVNVDVQYSYSILRVDGRRRYEFTPDPSRVAKMAAMEEHVTNRIDIVAAKLSHSLADEDGHPLFKISDGSESIEHYAVLTRETTLNRSLLEAEYGELLSFERALVLWNEDEEAYNLVVDDETIVDRIPV